MRFLSVCSGIEAASVAWHPLGWEPAAFAEIDPFPAAVLEHRFPEVPNLGDFTKIEDVGPVDLLVGGTPCQSFSVAGKRAGLDDPRGVLAFEFVRLAQRTRARWLVFENVAGLLSSNRGRDFGAFLGALADGGYGFAYRVLDAQHFGVPQRRRRVFVVGHLGDWRPSAAVLLEPESMRGDSPPRREAGESPARPLAAGHRSSGGYRNDADTAENLIAHSLRAEGFDASEDGTGRGTPLVTGELTAREGKGPDSDATTTLIVSDPISANEGRTYSHEGRNNFRLHNVIPFDENQITSPVNRSRCEPDGPSPSLATYGKPPSLATVAFVRRLTPRECERLQGFPDDWTLIPYRGRPAKDGPRYRAVGNSMPVPVMRWVGGRIALCEEALAGREVAA